VTVANPGPRKTALHSRVVLRVHASDSGAAALSYGASGLPAGLSINASTGVIAGIPTAARTSTVSVAVSDGFTNTGRTHFPWTILGPPTSSHASLGGLAQGNPKLVFTIGAGVNAPALKTLVLSLPSGLSFAKSSHSLAEGIGLKGANGRKLKFKLSLKRGKLTVTLGSAAKRAAVTISAPAIGVSSGLAARIGQGKIKRLSIALKAVDSSQRTTGVTLKLKV
jgi:hypothetical protein